MDIFSLFSSFFVTTASLFALKPVASRVGLLDHPGGRKTHTKPTPLIGGLGIYLGILLITYFSPTVFNHYSLMLGISAFVLFVGMGWGIDKLNTENGSGLALNVSFVVFEIISET